MSESLAEVKPGDTVILVSRNGDSVKEVTVDRVGYKYLYLRGYDCSPTEKFDLETGYSQLNYGWSRVVYTREGWALEWRRRDARDRLMDAGLTLSGHLSRNLTAQQLETILAVVAPDA